MNNVQLQRPSPLPSGTSYLHAKAFGLGLDVHPRQGEAPRELQLEDARQRFAVVTDSLFGQSVDALLAR